MTRSEGPRYPVQYSNDPLPIFDFTYVEPDARPLCPERFRKKVVVDTIHDGHIVPRRLLESPRVRPLVEDGSLWRSYVVERDWGANLVAKHLVRALGLGGFHNVTTARLVMDFNRFPGSSPPDATPLDRLAIIEPFSSVLNHAEKRYVLRKFYDAVSDMMEAAIYGKLIKIAVHTYDAFNESRTERPKVSLITRALSYQLHSHLPFGLFDPIFPDVLAESSCHSILRDRLAITLEKAGISVEHNYPYCAPDGSLEIRSQPWFYFQRVRSLFEESHPATRGRPAFDRVWAMLLNTNLRDGDAEALRGFLHRFRGTPEGLKDDFAAAAEAYEMIAEFTRSNPELITGYRRSPDRTSSLSIEVRKDLVFRFEDGEPVEPLEDNAREIAEKVAQAVAIYLENDREEVLSAAGRPSSAG